MDAQTFDRWTAAITRRPTRRAALGLVAGGLASGLLVHSGVAPVRAQARPDRDGDGLYDDDETDVYGANPDNPDTDGDGVDDGQEVYDGTDPLTPNGAANAAPACPTGDCVDVEAAPPGGLLVTCADAGLTDCSGVCVDVLTDAANCGGCGGLCGAGQFCSGAACLRSAPDGIDLGACASQGLTDCGGVCADLGSDLYNCGACGSICPAGAYCSGGACYTTTTVSCVEIGGDCSASRGKYCCTGVCAGPGFSYAGVCIP
jgi:hypothetical protein